MGGKGQRHWTGPDGRYFYLEDAESGRIRAPGLSVVGGHVVGVTSWVNDTDSVDEDDGTIDNATNGALSHSIYHQGGGPPLTINFDAATLGRLPTYVGFVITDCNPAYDTVIEVIDAQHRCLGRKKVYNSSFSAGEYPCGPGQAAKARFFGMVCSQDKESMGIASVVISVVNPNDLPTQEEDACFEVDHIQYGFVVSSADAMKQPDKQ